MTDSVFLLVVVLAALWAFFCRVWGYKDGYDKCFEEFIDCFGEKWFRADTPPKKGHEVVIKGLRMGRCTATVGSYRKDVWVDLCGVELDFTPVKWAFVPRQNKRDTWGGVEYK